MSDPKLISPLLDGFVMGGPISDHDGIRCCPAMKENSDNKYIVKIISIPASQVQLDALLLTGAYKDPAAALEYFKSLSEDVIAEAEALQNLSKLEGFTAFEGWQIVPMEDSSRLGYEVYLLGEYRLTLDKFMRRNAVTHLAAVNLGLDLCAALSAARSAGYLYTDLKPSNIFISDDREFTIGDLGLVKLDSLKYTALPGKYRSGYTAPELYDDLATIGETTDVYAAGMVLYQIYNNGLLPTQENTEENPLPSPLNADYEIAEVIMKAIAPDARDRWHTPGEMGQALAAYMQRNTVTDDPICPPLMPIEEVIVQEQPQVEAEAAPEELAFMEEIVSDETAPGDDDIQDLASQEVGQEVTAMLADAQEQIEHPLAEATIAVGTIHIPTMEDVAAQDAGDEQPAQSDADDDRRTMVVNTGLLKRPRKSVQIFDDEDDLDEDEDDYQNEAEEDASSEKPKKKFRPLLLLITTVLVCALLCGGYYFYRNYYLLEINELDVSGVRNQIVVRVDTEIDESMLIVVCSDTYGNTKRMTLTNGQAVFTDLTPDTVYKIQLEVSGFHKLSGPYYGSHITAAETRISEFKGTTGSEDGSVELSFQVTGPEKTPDWTVTYSAEGEEAITVPFTGHNVTITGLTVGKDYTFQLNPTSEELYMVGENTLVFTASQIILAEDLKITACADGNLSAQWSAPEGVTVESWNVVCYSDDGVKNTATVTEPRVTFSEIQAGKGYTVEVTAAGMTQFARTTISANPITVTEITVEDTDPETLTITWTYTGDAPEGGWMLYYTLDNGETAEVVRCDTTTAIISPRVPGAAYHLEIQTVSGTSVFMDEFVYACPEAEEFISNAYKLPSTHINSNLLVTPKENWSYHDVSGKRDYTDTFKVGDSISLLMRATVNSFYLPADSTNILFVIRDSEGNVIQNLVRQQTIDWCDIWNDDDFHYGELDLPAVPTEIGEYTVTVYFNGYQVCHLPFSITE